VDPSYTGVVKRGAKVSRVGVAFALAALLGLGIPMTIYLVGVGNRVGWGEGVPGENAAIILFGAGLPVLGASVIAYLVGAAMERRRQ